MSQENVDVVRRALATMCSFSAAKANLAAAQVGGTPASIYTVAVAKGRDNEWVGAVDSLRINGKVYNFEPYGVQEVTAPCAAHLPMHDAE